MFHFNVIAPVHKRCKEPSAPFQNQAHRREVSFSERQRREKKDSFDPCTTHDQLADIFTKPLDQVTFTRLRGELGVCLISRVGCVGAPL
jgi:hypothetical protein